MEIRNAQLPSFGTNALDLFELQTYGNGKGARSGGRDGRMMAMPI